MKKSEILKILGMSVHSYEVINFLDHQWLEVNVYELNSYRYEEIKDYILNLKPHDRMLKICFNFNVVMD